MHERTAHLYSVRTAKVKIKKCVALIYLGGESTGGGELWGRTGAHPPKANRRDLKLPVLPRKSLH